MQNQSKSADVVALPTKRKKKKSGEKCPICAKPSVITYKPFCSKRCADIDLGKWLGETYRIPADDFSESAADDDGDEDAQA